MSEKTMAESESERLWKEIEKKVRERRERMPTEADAIRALFDAYERLKELGWRDICYAPKDGTMFNSISVGSTGIAKAYCWAGGDIKQPSWWHPCDETKDLWPIDPIMFKPIEQPQGTTHED